MKPNNWYETKEDKRREKTVADKLAKAWDCKMYAMPEHHWFDYCAIQSGRVVAYVEIKTRTNSHAKYPTYMISSRKITNGLNSAALLKIKFLLVVQFTDALMFADVGNSVFNLNIGGTTKRNDEQDIEIVCQINMESFKAIILNEGNQNE